MPVYDYRCSDCHASYDIFHKGREITEDVICPSCGSANHRKLMSVPVVSIGTGSSGSKKSSASSCESGSCCGGSCGLN